MMIRMIMFHSDFLLLKFKKGTNYMKVIITKNVDVDMDKPRLREVWPKYLSKHDIFAVDKIEDISDDSVNLVLENGDVLLDVPRASFQIK